MIPNYCEVCDIPELPVDPLRIWENIPCPPPEFEDDLFSPLLLEKFGPEKGMAIVLNIARRCDIDVPKMFPTMGHVSGTFIFDTCGQDCVSVTIGICVSILLVMIVVAVAGFARREWGWFQPTHDKYVIDHISTMMSEDCTGSEYKYTKGNDNSSKLDEELSSIYVARWYKVFMGDNCSESEHSIHKHSTNSHCICKRLAEHIYEDIDSLKNADENTEILSQKKYYDSHRNIVHRKPQGENYDSEAETCDDKVSNDYQTLKLSKSDKIPNGVAIQTKSSSQLHLNESVSNSYVKENDDNECDVLLSDEMLDINYERLNSNMSAHSGTPLLNNDSTDSDSLTATV